ncbi:hypothetical protein MUK42_33667 [Musa troglodytarum]|uniref:Uncharacterized protein n=1 Tax=Musa troglodytarum TaxID=320322 RepID=A0A9E7JBU0_9LILI|nr:hypothetical protein MUK42_33667 [Musa troglodytarum]
MLRLIFLLFYEQRTLFICSFGDKETQSIDATQIRI